MLTVNNDRAFTILQLTDLHVRTKPFDEKDQQTFEYIRKLSDSTDPDLIIVTGDLISVAGKDQPEKSFRALIELFNSLEKPTMITYGNHDSEQDITREELRALESELTHQVPKRHVSLIDDLESYCIEIHDEDGELAHVLYVMDSGTYDPLEIGTYAFIHPKQINWFNNTSALYKEKKNKKTEDLLFLHIPLPEYEEAWQNGHATGTKIDPISAPVLNSGLFTSLLLDGEVKGVFAGHDHDNDFVANYHGIRLCYGRVSGFNSYGALKRGGRMIELQSDQPFTTYIV